MVMGWHRLVAGDSGDLPVDAEQHGDGRRATEGQGFRLRERLAIYPEFATRAEFLDERLRARVGALIDEHGLVKESYERWRRW